MTDNITPLTEAQTRAIVRSEMVSALALLGFTGTSANGDATVIAGPDADGFVQTRLSQQLAPDDWYQWDETWPLMTTDRQRAGLNLNCSVRYDGVIKREPAAWLGYADSGNKVTDCASPMPKRVDVRMKKDAVTGKETDEWYRTGEPFPPSETKFPNRYAIRADAGTFNEWLRRTAAERANPNFGTGGFSP